MPLESAIGGNVSLDLASNVRIDMDRTPAYWTRIEALDGQGLKLGLSPAILAQIDATRDTEPSIEEERFRHPSDEVEDLSARINDHVGQYVRQVQPTNYPARQQLRVEINGLLAQRYRRMKSRNIDDLRAALDYAKHTWRVDYDD